MSDARAIEPARLLEHSEWLLKLARRLVRDSSTADDLAQETLVKALRNPPSADRPLRPWLATVLHNLRLTRVRDDSRRRAREQGASKQDGLSAAPDEMAEATETLSVLIHELHRLEEPLRTVVSLRYMRELDSNQIAQELGIPAGTVRWRLKRGLDFLRENLDRRFGGSEQSRSRLMLLAGPAARSVWNLLPILSGMLMVCLLGWWVGPWNSAGPTAVPQIVSSRASAPEVTQAIPRGMDDELPLSTTRERTALASPPPESISRITLGFDQVAVCVQVVDASGTAIQGARLKWHRGKDTWVHSTQAGWAVLKFRPPGDRVRTSLSISESGYATRIIEADVQTGEWTLLGAVTLERTQAIEGRVVDEAGRPVTDVTLLVSPASVVGVEGNVERIGPQPWTEFLIPIVTSGRDGRFRLVDVPKLPVRVWAAKIDTLFSVSESIVDGADDLVLRLKPLPDADAIEGTVVGRDGEPIPHAFLRFTPRSAMRISTRPSKLRVSPAYLWSTRSPRIESDSAGRFRFIPRDRVPHDLIAEDPEDRWQDVVIEGVTPGTLGVRLQFLYELE